MSRDASNSDWLEKTLESTRRSVRQLEIDACRIRTDLAQLEVANAAGVVNGNVVAPPNEVEPDAPQSPLRVEALVSSPESTHVANPVPIAASDALDWQAAASSGPEGMNILVGAPLPVRSQSDFFDAQPIAAEPGFAELLPIADTANSLRGANRRPTSPVMASLVLHGTVLLLTFSITVATIERHEQQFSATVLDLGDTAQPAKQLENVDDHQLRDLGETVAQDLGSESKQSDVVGPLNQDPIPLDLKSVEGPVSLGAIGSLNAITADVGTLMAGAGGVSADGKGAATGLGIGNLRGRGGGAAAGGRKAGGRLETTLFFGTQAKGDRFVFVVDNSSSMKGGRLEIAIAELRKTIDAMSPRQSFYVIFVSDQTYPMFYPQREPALVAATPANKKRLANWAPNAILASGKNRELIKAMDMAAALQPQAVYLLWDGDLRYSEKVRADVMTHLTQPNQWNFIVHTLGMGISSLDSEQNLAAIAKAHNGIYRRIDVPVAKKR